jgi:2-polyprenyl-3-methyl-5-hydroxy-6-metoxy-1,4-benzoquinol methylase
LYVKKYTVQYFQCNECGFVQTETPYWLEESYNSAITFLDIGLVSRNINIAEKLTYIIEMAFDPNGRYLDFAGGYGMFVRLMRDKGYNFFRQDKYCENLFAKNFDIEDIKPEEAGPFEALTAFEIFEHLDKPLDEIRKMVGYSSNIIFSTELLPAKPIKDSSDWWYIAPETGQHIAFYTEKALHIIAKNFGLNYYKISNTLHLFSKKDIDLKWIKAIEKNGKLKLMIHIIII